MKRNYTIRDACFVCSSPYQIIGAIGIVKEMKMDADIYITGEFPEYRTIAEKLSRHNVFSNVYIADTRSVLGRGKAVSLEMTLFADRVVSGFMPGNAAYKACYASSRSTLKATMLGALRKRNPDMKRIVFEDGLGIYSDSGNLFKVSSRRKKLEHLLGWDIDDPSKMEIMSFIPELVTPPEFLGDIKVSRMPRLQMNEENRILLEDVFSVSDEQKITSKYIVFDTKRRGGSLDLLTPEEKALLDSCYDVIKSVADNSIICKPHPKSIERTTCDIEFYPYQSVPMEVLYMSMEDIEKRVLVSQVSTAIFTPKIFLDKEPEIICLHRILAGSQISQIFEAIYEKFRNTYRNPERVYAPSTIEELRTVLEKIQS